MINIREAIFHAIERNDETEGAAEELTCQGKHHQEHDDELEPDGEPFESVQLPALWFSREAGASGPGWSVVQMARLLQVVQAEELNNPAEEDGSQQWGHRLQILRWKTHHSVGVDCDSKICKSRYPRQGPSDGRARRQG